MSELTILDRDQGAGGSLQVVFQSEYLSNEVTQSDSCITVCYWDDVLEH